MVQISDVRVISVDKNDDTWAIEGEILFEHDLALAFFANYHPDDDEFEEVELELNPGKYDKDLLRMMMLKAAQEFDE